MIDNLRARLSSIFTNSRFGTPEKRADVYEWFLHNIIYGFAGVWVPFFALFLCGYVRTKEAVEDGELVTFAVTLSAVSLGFFVKETQINLRKREMLTYIGLMLTMMVGVITRVGLALGNKYPQLPLQMGIITCVTLVIVVLAIILNFRLFTLELDALDRRAVEKTVYQPVVDVMTQAKENAEVDNIKL
jgi:hypothetical protein